MTVDDETQTVSIYQPRSPLGVDVLQSFDPVTFSTDHGEPNYLDDNLVNLQANDKGWA